MKGRLIRAVLDAYLVLAYQQATVARVARLALFPSLALTRSAERRHPQLPTWAMMTMRTSEGGEVGCRSAAERAESSRRDVCPNPNRDGGRERWHCHGESCQTIWDEGS